MIKNVIFDVGDVLLEYRWKDMLMDYGFSEAESIKVGNLLFENHLWKELDLGVMTDEEVIREYEKLYPIYADGCRWFITNGQYMHVQRPKVWEKVHMLKDKGYKIFLLSNYSKSLFDKHTKDATFLNDIDGKVVSYQIHIAKPDRRIYEYLLDEYSLKAEECIFFDDRKENTQAAKQLGIKSYTVISQDYLLRQLDLILSNQSPLEDEDV